MAQVDIKYSVFIKIIDTIFNTLKNKNRMSTVSFSILLYTYINLNKF